MSMQLLLIVLVATVRSGVAGTTSLRRQSRLEQDSSQEPFSSSVENLTPKERPSVEESDVPGLTFSNGSNGEPSGSEDDRNAWKKFTEEEASIPVPSVAQSGPPCNCDCCEVESRWPGDEITITNNARLDYRCGKPYAVSSACPSQCSLQDGSSVIGLKLGNDLVDYSRFCVYKCKPTTPTPGSTCRRLNATETSMSTEPTMNGVGDNPYRSVAVDKGEQSRPSWEPKKYKYSQQAAAEEDNATVTEKQASGEPSSAETKTMTWDLRKLIANRHRAEAGSEMTYAAAAGERVRKSAFSIKQASMLTKRMSDIISPAESEIDESMIQTEGNATAAEESAVTATKSVRLAEGMYDGSYLQDTRKLAEEAIEQAAAPAAEEEAKVDAKRFGWDKPDFWPKVLAVKAADPYMAQMSIAAQRASEYQSYAKSLVSQAKSVQDAAVNLNSIANALQSQGDKVGAATKFKQVKGLIARSKKMQAEAQKFWKVASDTQKTLPEWQSAAMGAANYAVAMATPPTPPADLQ
eukprot:gnl/TRDRNA2_/TRDRNA2_164956_c0_seq5.p1 gnl/TRDRNA2_/TRDRNA2_164956_c0~~gnl/TRDRNA2_/TRDRNA2_164956_c0_seq5.p1  ORF type:complete len:521 (-),score=102.46 gnl/TRDRNA2_/TRDRNA2_164956_c0_seq5:158-1720(-)